MLLDILRFPDPKLRRLSEPVAEITDDIIKFCADLSETMIERDGVGLAAPQVGWAIRIFVLNDRGPKIFINPEVIENLSPMVAEIEGCLSFPEIFIKVARPESVTVKAMALDGTMFEEAYSGLMARAALHEQDHLNGKLLIDHVSWLKREFILKKLKKAKAQW